MTVEETTKQQPQQFKGVLVVFGCPVTNLFILNNKFDELTFHCMTAWLLDEMCVPQPVNGFGNGQSRSTNKSIANLIELTD